MPDKKQDRGDLGLLCAAVFLSCLVGVFVLLWRRNDHLACRPRQHSSPHSHHAKTENYGNSEPHQSSDISGHIPAMEVGCYKIMPTGCGSPPNSMPEGLFRDKAGDANADLCAMRKAAFDETCTRNDAGWLYVSKKPTPQGPDPEPEPFPSPSPSPSPSHPFKKNGWVKYRFTDHELR